MSSDPTSSAPAPPDTAGRALDPRETRRAVVCSTVGNAIEAYDFLIYALIAPLVFPQVFFPAQDPTVGVLLSLSTYFVAFLARPIGAAVFGHFGDRVGRKQTLVITILLMGIGTVGVGLVPTYDVIGPAAAWILVLLRVITGIALGGEWTGASLMAMESGPARRGGLLTSIAQAANPVGIGLSILVLLVLTTATTPEQLVAGAWRIPFVASIVLVGLGLWMRLRVHETVEFARLRSAGERVQMPVREVFRRQPLTLLLTVLLKAGEMVATYTFIVFVISYSSGAGIDRGLLLLVLVISTFLTALVMPVFGHLADKLGGERVFGVVAVAVAVFAFVYYPALLNGGNLALAIVVPVSVLGFGAMFAVEGIILNRSFHRSWRYSGAALAFNLAGIIGAGPAPLVATALAGPAGSSTLPLSVYLAASCLISAVAAAVLYRRRLGATQEGIHS